MPRALILLGLAISPLILARPAAPQHQGPGFSGPDGRSTMPSYNEVLTVQELIDLVASLKSLTGGGGHGGMEGH